MSLNPKFAADQLHDLEQILNSFQSLLPHLQNRNTRALRELSECMYLTCACVHAKSLPSCPILCYPIDHSPPGSFVHGVLQARILE